jgi:hypothetical protein
LRFAESGERKRGIYRKKGRKEERKGRRKRNTMTL